MIQIDMEMPKCCDECFALDDHGDYPFCLISQDQRGYTFNTKEKRMPTCPLKAQEALVMDVDEVREWVGKQRVDREPICVEVKDSICAWIVSDEYWDLQMDINLSRDLYGRTWRCWTSRPSEAEREATPWMT